MKHWSSVVVNGWGPGNNEKATIPRTRAPGNTEKTKIIRTSEPGNIGK